MTRATMMMIGMSTQATIEGTGSTQVVIVMIARMDMEAMPRFKAARLSTSQWLPGSHMAPQAGQTLNPGLIRVPQNPQMGGTGFIRSGNHPLHG
jgi:hypothetical protein